MTRYSINRFTKNYYRKKGKKNLLSNDFPEGEARLTDFTIKT